MPVAAAGPWCAARPPARVRGRRGRLLRAAGRSARVRRRLAPGRGHRRRPRRAGPRGGGGRLPRGRGRGGHRRAGVRARVAGAVRAPARARLRAGAGDGGRRIGRRGAARAPRWRPARSTASSRCKPAPSRVGGRAERPDRGRRRCRERGGRDRVRAGLRGRPGRARARGAQPGARGPLVRRTRAWRASGDDPHALVAALADAAVRDALAAAGPATVDGYGAFRVRDALRARLRRQFGPERAALPAGHAGRLRSASSPGGTILRPGPCPAAGRDRGRGARALVRGPYCRPRRDAPGGRGRARDRRDRCASTSTRRRPRSAWSWRPSGASEGIGAQAVREASELLLAARPELERVRAEVLQGNEASLAAFTRAGFAPAPGAAEGGGSLLILDRPGSSITPDDEGNLTARPSSSPAAPARSAPASWRRCWRDHDPRAVRIFSRDELKQSELQRRFADDDAAALPPRRRARPAAPHARHPRGRRDRSTPRR